MLNSGPIALVEFVVLAEQLPEFKNAKRNSANYLKQKFFLLIVESLFLIGGNSIIGDSKLSQNNYDAFY